MSKGIGGHVAAFNTQRRDQPTGVRFPAAKRRLSPVVSRLRAIYFCHQAEALRLVALRFKTSLRVSSIRDCQPFSVTHLRHQRAFLL
jgi:hypothetical protein